MLLDVLEARQILQNSDYGILQDLRILAIKEIIESLKKS